MADNKKLALSTEVPRAMLAVAGFAVVLIVAALLSDQAPAHREQFRGPSRNNGLGAQVIFQTGDGSCASIEQSGGQTICQNK
jgi:hypothetical protein